MIRRPQTVATAASHWPDVIEPGETLLWQGRPKRLPMIRPITIGLGLFGLPFLGFGFTLFVSLLIELVGSTEGFGPVLFTLFLMLFSLTFLATGLAFLLLPAYVGHNAPDRVAYALTDRHAYIASRWLGQKVRRFPVSQFDIRTSERAGGSISFWRIRSRDGDTKEAFAFRSLGDVSEVEAIARRLTAGG